MHLGILYYSTHDLLFFHTFYFCYPDYYTFFFFPYELLQIDMMEVMKSRTPLQLNLV